MSALIAITREVSSSIAFCELTHLRRQPIDVSRARAQHSGYERALERLGCRVRRLPSRPDMPDGVFVEDVAVVLDEVAVSSRPGARSRRPETAAVAAELAQYRFVVRLTPPATLDGGDVLVAGRSIFVGRTGRTNDAGIDQLRHAVDEFGYSVTPVEVRGCLHLKSAVTALDDQTLLINRRWVSGAAFAGFDLIDVDPAEPLAANIVRAGSGLIYASAFPRTRNRIEHKGYTVTTVDVSELAKAEGAVTCCSLIFRDKKTA